VGKADWAAIADREAVEREVFISRALSQEAKALAASSRFVGDEKSDVRPIES
jgi:hypothetical protein